MPHKAIKNHSQILKNLRMIIKHADKKIAEQIGKRFQAAKKIAKIKKRNSLPVTDASRERELLVYYQKLAAYYKIDRQLLLKIFKALIQFSKSIQKNAKKP